MTQLSPAAQAIIKAFDDRYELLGPLEDDWREQCIAAALGALADQVVPEDGDPIYGLTPTKADRQIVRRKLLAIATELEGQ